MVQVKIAKYIDKNFNPFIQKRFEIKKRISLQKNV